MLIAPGFPDNMSVSSVTQLGLSGVVAAFSQLLNSIISKVQNSGKAISKASFHVD